MVVVSLGERRRLEEEYVNENWDKLERGTPITAYSAGPDSLSREITLGKMETLANELAVIANERARGAEVERNWSLAEPTPSPTVKPGPEEHPPLPTPTPTSIPT